MLENEHTNTLKLPRIRPKASANIICIFSSQQKLQRIEEADEELISVANLIKSNLRL